MGLVFKDGFREGEGHEGTTNCRYRTGNDEARQETAGSGVQGEEGEPVCRRFDPGNAPANHAILLMPLLPILIP